MIHFNNVKKEYKDNDFVLGELNFQINEGEFVFVIGPSGSGKTSLIKLLIREEEPTHGKIFFDDYDITRLTRDSIYKLRRYIGVIFQDYKLIPDKTVSENVAFAMEVAGKSNREINETIPYLLDIVGLSHRADAFPEYLSGGEKQRVAIARAVSNNPKVLIADEPTGNLDPAAAWDIVQILSKINNWGTTVIMSTHGTDIVNTLNKRVIQMHQGVIVRDDNKGLYEVNGAAKQPEEKQSDDPASNSQSNQGPIRVRIKSNSGLNEQQTKGRNGLLKWLWPFGKKTEEVHTPLEEEFGKKIDSEIAKAEFAQDVDSLLAKESEGEVAEFLTKADKTPIRKLNLRPEIIADLETAGYHDVEDVIVAGPEKLSSELVIDPEEEVLVARAIAEFINTEHSHRALVQKPNLVAKQNPKPEISEEQSAETEESKAVETETAKGEENQPQPERELKDQAAAEEPEQKQEKVESKPKSKKASTSKSKSKSSESDTSPEEKSNVRLDLTGKK